MSETGDGLDHLRIPFEKIKFGKKLEVQGYGTVFEGEFDGQRVALKQLNITNLANIKPKLLAEILTISRFRQHPNLVALLGFCDEKSNEIILVYEYVASGNLADKMRKRLTTIQRFEICLGAARGLDYLHTGVDPTIPGIVHGNIKPSKILLNSDANSSKFQAKVSSFGLSKIVPGKAQKTLESFDEVIGKATKESDVYSFGVLLLEVLCGVSELVDTDDYQERHVTELVPKKMEQNKLQKIVHFDIRKEIKPEALETYAKIACQCVMENPDARPKMDQVVEELEKALRLQGGEVTYVQIPGGRKIAGANDDTFVEDGSKDDSNGVTVESNIHGNEPEDVNVPTTEEDQDVKDVKDVTIGDKLDDAGEDNGASESGNGEKDAVQDSNTEVQDSGILKSDRGDFNEAIEDGLERLRIPIEKIKFGQKIDVRGYGTIFEGEFNHQRVALKRLNITNLGNIKPKLLSAILTVYRFRRHPNLVALIGFCDENNKEIILVYEYVSGGNLADKMSKHLTTIQRLQICLGAARGLEYLHHGVKSFDSKPGIIHGHVKLSKILLNWDSISSTFEAKVSGYGFPKLLPGHVEIGPKSMDPVHTATGKLTKESDVYTFGVLLLEVLCGVPELVDTDDYQERHVTEMVPKRLEQNMLRKIVHFDIRDEITTESLETYAKIACRCVMKNPEERPTMSEVVEELEKALRLQGGKASDVQIFGSGNGNGLTEVPVGEDDHQGDDNGETKSSNITEEESNVEKSSSVPISGSNDAESVPEDAEKENGNNMNDPDNTKEITVDLKLNEESQIIGKNEVNNESKITSKSDNGDDCNSAVGGEVFDAQHLASSNGISQLEPPVGEDDQEGDDNGETMSSNKAEEESKVIEEPTDDIALKVEKSEIVDENAKAGSLNNENPELIVNIRGDFSNSPIQTQESESKRRNSSCSESSNGDDTTPSDYLLPKSPVNGKKTSRGSRTCCSCSCSWCRFISDRVVFYGGQFWNKLVSCFTWITGQCSSKKD